MSIFTKKKVEYTINSVCVIALITNKLSLGRVGFCLHPFYLLFLVFIKVHF